MNIKILSVLCLVFCFGCQEDNGNGDDAKNDEALIVNMSFDFGDVTFEGNEGSINAPENTDVENLTPAIVISAGAVINPASNTVTDFTEPVVYTVTSEDGNNVNHYTVSVHLPLIKFTANDCTNRSPEDPTAELAPDTEISIYKDVSGVKELIEAITTDENGEALFYGDRELDYYFLADKEGAVNIINGYIIAGIFQNEADIDSSPPQLQSSEVGDLKFMDVTADGMVNEADIVDYREIWYIPESGTEEITVYISNE